MPSDTATDPALTTTPARMWTVARQAADHGWQVTVFPPSPLRRGVRMHLDAPGRDAITVVWTFWYKTHPGGPGSWRLDHAMSEPHRGSGGRASEKRIKWDDVLWYANQPVAALPAPEDAVPVQ